MAAVARSEPAASDGHTARTRLAALEHLVDAVVVLLDAGELDRARALAHARRNTRQGRFFFVLLGGAHEIRV